MRPNPRRAVAAFFRPPLHRLSPRSRPLRRASAAFSAGALTVAMLLAACSGAPAPTPVGGPAPTPSPSVGQGDRSTATPADASSPSGARSPTGASTSPVTGSPSPSGSSVPGGSSATPSSDPSAVPPSGTPVAPEQLRLRLVAVADGLDLPLLLAAPDDGSGRRLVVEQRGRILVLDAGGAVAAEPFLDIRDRVSQSGDERGLLGLALHRGFAENGRLFVDYTDRQGNTVVSEFGASAPAGEERTEVDPGTERVLLRIEQPYANHNGGMLAFGPDGMLYIGTGDGGSGGDPQGNGQRRSTLLGKILRIDVDAVEGAQGSGVESYAIPVDNPFAGGDGGSPEIWALGLRNPWRFSFDRATGVLFVGDVGQDRYEEVTVLGPGVAGANLGWNVMEGRHCFEPAQDCDRAGLTLPSVEYGHDQGCSVTGGYVYRGSASPALFGTYLLADFCSGQIWGVRADEALAGRVTLVLLLESGLRIASFGEDAAGELYVVDLGGSVLRVTATAR